MSFQAPPKKNLKLNEIDIYLENKLLLISINFTPKKQPQLPKIMVLSYLFQVGCIL